MNDYIHQFQSPNNITIVLQVESNYVMTIGDALQKLHEYAYMNGYNWDAVLSHYLEKHHPELTEGLDRDPEAGSYAMHYPNEVGYIPHAQALEQVIRSLLQDKERLSAFVQAEGNHIPWD